MRRVPIAFLLHGPPGCGKTTFARQLEEERNVVRFSHDEWMVVLHGQNPPAENFAEYHDRISKLIWIMAERVLASGRDVALDLGFWSRASRDEARARISQRGFGFRLCAFDYSIEEVKQRVLARTQALPSDCLFIDSPTFDLLCRRIEPLGADEEHLIVPSGPDQFAGIFKGTGFSDSDRGGD